MLQIKTLKKKLEQARAEKLVLQNDFAEAFYFGLKQDYYMADNAMKMEQNQQIELLDSTASEALDGKVADLMAKLFPRSHPFIRLKRDGNNKLYDTELAAAEQRFDNAIKASNFYPEITMALKHAMIANGNIIIARGDTNMPIRFRAVPMWQVFHSASATGELFESFVESQMTWAEIESAFEGKGELSKASFADLDEESLETVRHKVIEYYKTNRDGTTDYCLFSSEKNDGSEGVIIELAATVELQFISFRYGRVCGSVYGQGPLLKALPDIRVVNQVQYYRLQDQLRSLGYVVMGDHDRIPFEQLKEPGNIHTLHVPVGMPMPTVLNTAANQLQSDQFITAEYQSNIMRKVGNNPLPRAEQGGRRTATEYEMRSAMAAVNNIPDSVNIYRELFMPLVNAVLQILQNPIISGSEFAINPPPMDDETARPLWNYEPDNDIENVNKSLAAENTANAVALMIQLFPEEYNDLVMKDKLARDVAKLLGLPDSVLNSEATVADNKAARDQERQAMISKGMAVNGNQPQVEARQLP